MARAAGAFRRAIQAARERTDAARAICVRHPCPGQIVSGSGWAMGRLAAALAREEQERADAALEALLGLAERTGLVLDVQTETGDLAERAAQLVRAERVDALVLIRPRSERLADDVDRAADAVQNNFDGELLIIK